MSNIRKRSDLPPVPAPSSSETGLLTCMALVVAAIVVGLHVQMGLSLGLAAVAGLALFTGMAGFHAWRRVEAEREALADELHRLEAELHMAGAGAGPYVAGSGPLLAPQTAASSRGALMPAPAMASMPPLSADRMPGPAGRDAPQVEPAPLPAAMPRFAAYHGAPTVAPGESLTDYWQSHDAATAFAREPQAAAAAEEPVMDEAAPSAVREDDVEMLQRRIKDMLYQVTVAEQARDLAAAMPAEPAHEAISKSVEALTAVAQSMRQRATGVPIPDTPMPMQPAAVSADAQLSGVREALAAGRLDVFLEPILGLGDQATQHYEVSIRPRGPAGEDLGLDDGDVLVGRGLLPLLDAARIERSAIVAERLQSRGKYGSVFSRASGEALIEPEFTRNMQIDFVARPETARQLILTLSQADIRSFRAVEQRSVSALAALGLRFAIAGLTDLDMNFAAMAQAGFAFVKIDAAVMIDGLAYPGGHIPASDVCRFLADQGFGLIVEGIDSEEILAKVFGFGVLMGQGTLFGGRRPVKADVAAKHGQAAA